ncbi:MAG: hypothetical protein V5A27_03190 [Halapricum sp.]
MIEPDDRSERDQIRAVLTDNIQRLDERVQDAWEGDLDADAEPLQLQRLRTLAHLAREFRLLARDEDIDDLEAEVDLLQQAQELKEGER